MCRYFKILMSNLEPKQPLDFLNNGTVWSPRSLQKQEHLLQPCIWTAFFQMHRATDKMRIPIGKVRFSVKMMLKLVCYYNQLISVNPHVCLFSLQDGTATCPLFYSGPIFCHLQLVVGTNPPRSASKRQWTTLCSFTRFAWKHMWAVMGHVLGYMCFLIFIYFCLSRLAVV